MTQGHTYPESTATFTREQYEDDSLEVWGGDEDDKDHYTDYPEE